MRDTKRNVASAAATELPATNVVGQQDGSLVDPYGDTPDAISRRRFLEAAGFSFSIAALSGCGRAPTELALPMVTQPEGMVPGRMRAYASTCAGCPAACGLLVGVRDGRPLKMEGMPGHPLSRGGLCATGQALPLGLYDSHRLKEPLQDGQPADWEVIDQQIQNELLQIADNGGAVRFVTPTVTSPTLRAAIGEFLEPFNDARHVIFDPVSCSAILDAHQITHGERLLPHFKFDAAQLIVSFGADFLGTWISPVEFTAAWCTRRAPTKEHPQMSFHVQFESRLSLTGSNADRRHQLLPQEYAVTLSRLAARLADVAGESPPDGRLGTSPIPDAVLNELVDRLWDARGKSLVVSDSQDVNVQLLVNFINHVLGNYDTTVDIQRPSQQRQSNDGDVLKLIDELRTGTVAALLVAGTDLTQNLPDRESLADAIAKVPLVVSLVEREDDFASLARFVCPDHHSLESWLDYEPVDGVVGLSQPTIAPLMNTRSILESLARWRGTQNPAADQSAYEILRAHWERAILPRADAQPFEQFWNRAVHDGVVAVAPNRVSAKWTESDKVKLVEGGPEQTGYVAAMYPKIGLMDSRHAHNPWLQELPDPITKATWDNHVCVSPATAKQLGLADSDVVRLETQDGGTAVELPVLIQPGQHDRVLAMALGYGVKGTDRFANIGPQWLHARPTVKPGALVGKNVAGFLDLSDSAIQYFRSGVKLTKTGRRQALARTQRYSSLNMPPGVAPRGGEIRRPVQHTTLGQFRANPEAGAAHVHHHSDEQLWPENHPKEGHWWAMAIDLNKCTGCSACVIACQSENNVPVVGKDEVRRQREMQWIRIDRYYSGEGDDVDVLHQPMMCQHCDNAPCETVCPVLATVHSEEGLNVQVYNRCVGTRYCANNCPYKVRRFNWFDYPRDDQIPNLALNPDVTVRTRGVMEKCSMCIQRIEEARIEARRNGEPLVDGTIQTACQQSCPAQAIVMGDVNDPESRVRAAIEDPRQYRVLEEFNFRPSVAYLRVVKNRDDHEAEGAEHG